MTRRPRLLAATVLAACAIGLGTVGADAAPSSFKVTLSGSASTNWTTTSWFSGGGTASRLGRVSNQGHADILGYATTCAGGFVNVNTETFTDLDDTGDTLTISSADVACPVGPGQFDGTGQWVVVGGTGRYTGASGGGSFAGFADFFAGTFSFTFVGTLEVPGAS